jgi:cytochrome c556
MFYAQQEVRLRIFTHKRFYAAMCAILLFTAAAPAFSADDPKQIIKYRKGVMKAVSGHGKAMKSITGGKVSRTTDWKAHAEAMVSLATMSATLFPKGTGPEAGKTRALPSIWEDKPKYDKINDQWVAAAKSMLAAANIGDLKAGQAAAKALSKSCKDCHKPFRKKKKKKKK